MVVGVKASWFAWGLVLLFFALVPASCGGPTPGSICVTHSDCPDGLACGPLETCEEPRMIEGCRMTEKCQEFGYCLAHEGNCRATDASCRASLYCQRAGYCSAQKAGLGCMVASDADCALSDVCKHGGKCAAFRGRCDHGQRTEEAAAE